MNVIICDDYQLIVKSLIRGIQQIDAQAECHGFTDATEVLEYIRSNPVDAALLDIDMPDIDGLTLGRAILERYPRTNIIFVTGHPEFALEAHELYASSFLVKPVTLEALRNAFSHFRYPVAGALRKNTSDFYNGKSVLGKNIRNLRTKYGMSVNELAEKCDVSVQTVYRWEDGDRIPDIVKFVFLADLFGVEIHTLLN